MKNYLILYKKEPSFQENNLLNSNAPWWPEKAEFIMKNFEPVAPFEAESLHEVYHHFQAEVWSPNGEARPLIRALHLKHTSMSVGDLIFCSENSTLYEVGRSGFNIVAENVNWHKS